MISTCGMNRAARSANSIMSTAPMAKLGATNRHVPSGARSASSSSLSGDSPVVPTTQSTPAGKAVRMLPSTAEGWVKSTITSGECAAIASASEPSTVIVPPAPSSSASPAWARRPRRRRPCPRRQ